MPVIKSQSKSGEEREAHLKTILKTVGPGERVIGSGQVGQPNIYNRRLPVRRGRAERPPGKKFQLVKHGT